MLLIEYPPCSTCKRAKNWLTDRGAEFSTRHIKDENPTAGEIARWQEESGLPLKRFFNTSGMRYRELELKDRLPNMSREEQLELLASDGMLVKRPILVTEKGIAVGFRENEWVRLLEK